MHALKKLLQKWGISVICILVGGLLIVAALTLFQVETVRVVEQSIHKNMSEINQSAALTLRNEVASCQDLLKLQARLLGGKDAVTDREVLALLSDFAQDPRFERLSFITLSGKVYSSSFGVHQLDAPDALPHLRGGETSVGQPRADPAGDYSIDISVPVYHNNQRTGRLAASLNEEILRGMYRVSGLDGDAALCLFAGDGTIIASFSNRPVPLKPGENVFESIIGQDFRMIDGSADEYRKNVLAQKSGWLKYELNGNNICLNYEPMGVNDWYLSITATDHVLDLQSSAIRQLGLRLALCIVAVVLAVSVVVIVQRIKEQKRIDDLKNTYNVAIRKTNDLFYEADIDSDQLVDHSENADKAIWKEKPKNYSNALRQVASICSPEYRQQFLDTFLPQNIKIKIKEGISSINFEYKITPDESTVRWLSATFVPVTDASSHSTKLICMENDITEQKLRQERLRHSATVDGLTGLYNRSTTQSCIDSFLEGEGFGGQHAMLLIDIDYFKAVNDTLGHIKGDVVLTEYSQKLRKIFRRNDIVGRIGGDEFIVLLKDYGVPELITAKAADICAGFREAQFLEDAPERQVLTSASIGIARYDRDGKTFDELYRSADTAMYAAKREGRDRYHFFEKSEPVPHE